MRAISASIPASPSKGFARVDDMMAQARATYAANPQLVADIRARAVAKLPKPLPPTPEDLDFNERLDRAIAKSSGLIEEARAQLAAPVSAFLPAELIPDELAENQAAEEWARGCELADQTTTRTLQNNQKLFEDVMGLLMSLKRQVYRSPTTLSCHRHHQLRRLRS